MSFHSYEPLHGHNLKHDPFGSIIAPRPIGWISTKSAGGVSNLAPYSFFNAFNYRPPIIGFASVGRKDSLSNVEQTGVFGWNLATTGLAEQVNSSSVDLPADGNEFEYCGLSEVAGDIIDAPLVAESPVRFECRVSQIVRLQDTAGAPIDTWLVMGVVVKVHIAEHLIVDDTYVTAAGDPLLRGGGYDYFRLDNDGRFEMRRPVRPG